MTTKPDPAPIATDSKQKRQYRRRSITNGPGTTLVIEQEQKLAEARKIARALNDIEGMSEWALDRITSAVTGRISQLRTPPQMANQKATP